MNVKSNDLTSIYGIETKTNDIVLASIIWARIFAVLLIDVHSKV